MLKFGKSLYQKRKYTFIGIVYLKGGIVPLTVKIYRIPHGTKENLFKSRQFIVIVISDHEFFCNHLFFIGPSVKLAGKCRSHREEIGLHLRKTEIGSVIGRSDRIHFTSAGKIMHSQAEGNILHTLGMGVFLQTEACGGQKFVPPIAASFKLWCNRIETSYAVQHDKGTVL